MQIGLRQVGRALCALLLGACSSHPAAQTAAAAAPAPQRGAAVQPEPGQPPPSQPAPAVRVEAVTDVNGELAIRVQNHAAEPVELAPVLRVERATDRGFEAIANGELRLHAGSECVQLTPGGELRPSWPPAGTATGGARLRLVLYGCGDRYRIDGEPFDASPAR